MSFSGNKLESQTKTQRLAELVENLSLDDKRALSRLLNSWEKRDQRKHHREKCSIVTEFQVDNRDYKGLICNISPYGAYIACPHQFPVNQIIIQSFFFPNFEIPIRSNSQIVWTESDGFGVKFDRLQSDE